MSKSIFILSASDRFNYGDLLFPIIAEKELSKYGNFNFHNVGIVKSNLESIGALPTKKYSFLYKVDSKTSNSILLVAGGEVVGANWMRLYSFVYPRFSGILKFLSNIERAISKLGPVIRNPIPFVPVDKRLTNRYKIVFNAVGGRKVGHRKLQKRAEKTFENCLFLSLREKDSFESIKAQFPTSNPEMAPDSAVVMSDHYQFEKNNDGYIAFQVGHYKNEGKLEVINQQLFQLYKSTNLPVKFVPIGNCAGHDDILSLKWLMENAEYPCEIVSPENLEKIMRTIAQSKLFMGTSLHGIITAMSFAVPYVGLNPKISKLKSYIFTWAPEQLRVMSNFDDLFEKGMAALQVENSILEKNAEMQKRKARDSFKKIGELINNLN